MTAYSSNHAAAAHPKTRLFRFPGDNANVRDCSKIDINTLREKESRDRIFFSSVANTLTMSSGDAGSIPAEA
ncbi:hypothetical protein TcBrA4_0042510 [Trypanosoma cruzi]|nr:hypothetical protein TcBrA4_0042510 [Trypanosoma cruzi]